MQLFLLYDGLHFFCSSRFFVAAFVSHYAILLNIITALVSVDVSEYEKKMMMNLSL